MKRLPGYGNAMLDCRQIEIDEPSTGCPICGDEQSVAVDRDTLQLYLIRRWLEYGDGFRAMRELCRAWKRTGQVPCECA
jgi:hypothetical protein